MLWFMLYFSLGFNIVCGHEKHENNLKCTDEASSTLLRYAKEHPYPATLTTQTGVPVTFESTQMSNNNMFLNQYFMETYTRFDRERIPERVVHARGAGAFGYFEVTHDISDVCKADVFNGIGKKTAIAVRFSSSEQLRGGNDVGREVRGFAVKMYTKDGNFDLTMLNSPMFFINNPQKLPFITHSLKPSPVHFGRDYNPRWDCFNSNIEIYNFLTWLYSDDGITDGYRHMPGFSIHTIQVSNSKNETNFVRFTALPSAGRKCLSPKRAMELRGSHHDYFIQDLYKAIANGTDVSWTLYIQVACFDDVKKAAFNLFDMTQTWPVEQYPLRPIGRIILKQNPVNYFSEVEMLAYNPGNLVPGIQGAPDLIFETRCFSYRDSANYRLGPNFNNIPINKPQKMTHTYLRDGSPPVGDNGRDAPHYYPNSFNGPKPVANTDPPLIRLNHSEIPCRLIQSRQLYQTFSDDERERFIDNLAEQFENVQEDLQKTALSIFNEISSDIPRRYLKREKEKRNSCYENFEVPKNCYAASCFLPSCDIVADFIQIFERG